jgi:gas vesicle protein
VSSARVSVDGQSEISLLPPQNIEKKINEVENLKWQIQYEKKLHSEMSQLLEDKVSNLMASVKDLKAEIVSLNETVEEHE